MKPSDWISLGALAVAAISIVISALVAPRIAARLERGGRIRDERSDAYAETIRLLHSRVSEVDCASYGWSPPPGAPSAEESAKINARLLIYASKPVWDTVQTFFDVYFRTAPDQLKSSIARNSGDLPSPDALAARLRLVPLRDQMQRLLEQAVNHMRDDLGTKRLLWTERQPTIDTSITPPEGGR